MTREKDEKLELQKHVKVYMKDYLLAIRDIFVQGFRYHLERIRDILAEEAEALFTVEP